MQPQQAPQDRPALSQLPIAANAGDLSQPRSAASLTQCPGSSGGAAAARPPGFRRLHASGNASKHQPSPLTCCTQQPLVASSRKAGPENAALTQSPGCEGEECKARSSAHSEPPRLQTAQRASPARPALRSSPNSPGSAGGAAPFNALAGECGPAGPASWGAACGARLPASPAAAAAPGPRLNTEVDLGNAGPGRGAARGEAPGLAGAAAQRRPQQRQWSLPFVPPRRAALPGAAATPSAAAPRAQAAGHSAPQQPAAPPAVVTGSARSSAAPAEAVARGAGAGTGGSGPAPQAAGSGGCQPAAGASGGRPWQRGAAPAAATPQGATRAAAATGRVSSGRQRRPLKRAYAEEREEPRDSWEAGAAAAECERDEPGAWPDQPLKRLRRGGSALALEEASPALQAGRSRLAAWGRQAWQAQEPRAQEAVPPGRAQACADAPIDLTEAPSPPERARPLSPPPPSGGAWRPAAQEADHGAAGGGRSQPWWSRLADFVPLAALADGTNPRTGAVVFVDYAKQFAPGKATPQAERAPGAGGRAGAKARGGGGGGRKKFIAKKRSWKRPRG